MLYLVAKLRTAHYINKYAILKVFLKLKNTTQVALIIITAIYKIYACDFALD